MLHYYTMIIKVDVREHELIKIITQLINTIPSFKDLQFTTENLPLGDIIITDNLVHNLIIERKTINDLFSSLKDGRYEEQSYRLNGLPHHNHNIIYLIEGDVNNLNRFKDNRVDKLTLYSTIFSLNYYKGFSVLRTFNIEETAIFICNTANKLKKSEAEKRKPYYSLKITEKTVESTKEATCDNDDEKQENESNENTNTHEATEKDYISVIKKVKKDNITPDNIGEIMLCQIPGISCVTALAIIDKFKTISNLITSIEKDEKCLDNIVYTTSKNQQRKINKSSILNISKFLLKK